MRSAFKKAALAFAIIGLSYQSVSAQNYTTHEGTKEGRNGAFYTWIFNDHAEGADDLTIEMPHDILNSVNENIHAVSATVYAPGLSLADVAKIVHDYVSSGLLPSINSFDAQKRCAYHIGFYNDLDIYIIDTAGADALFIDLDDDKIFHHNDCARLDVRTMVKSLMSSNQGDEFDPNRFLKKNTCKLNIGVLRL